MYQPLDITEALKIATDPATSTERLTKLLLQYHGELDVAKAAARHPNLSPQLFGRMTHCLPEDAAKNPRAAEYRELKGWEHHYSRRPGAAFAKYTDIVNRKRPQAFFLHYYMQHGSATDKRQILAVENIPADLVRDYTSSKNANLRKAIAGRETVPDGTYETLAKDQAKTVRAVLAANPHLPAELIAKLSTDAEAVVVEAALANPSCPATAKQAAKLVAAAKPSLGDRALEQLSSAQRIALANDPATASDKLDALALDEDPCVRYLSGLHANASAALLERLATDSVDWVREAPAFNAKSPVALLEQLAKSKRPGVLEALASNPALSEALQLQLIDQLSEAGALILANSTDSLAVWQALAAPAADTARGKQKKTWRDHLWLAVQDDVKTGKLRNLQRAGESKHWFITKIAARSPKCPPSLQSYYAYYAFDQLSRNPQIALQLLENPNAIARRHHEDWLLTQWFRDGNAPGYVTQYALRGDDLSLATGPVAVGQRSRVTCSATSLLATFTPASGLRSVAT